MIEHDVNRPLRPNTPDNEAEWRAWQAQDAVRHGALDAHGASPTPERLVAIRTELIRLCHSNSDDASGVVSRADAYLNFILNGNKGESTNAD